MIRPVAMRVFGWKINWVTLDKDTEFRVTYPKTILAEDGVAWNCWTQGGFDTTECPEGCAEVYVPERREAGYVMQVDLKGQIIPAGTYTAKVYTDSEFWCLDKSLNGQNYPELSLRKVLKGKTITLPVGTNVLVANGSTSLGDAPAALSVETESTKIKALTDTYLIYFSSKRS